MSRQAWRVKEADCSTATVRAVDTASEVYLILKGSILAAAGLRRVNHKGTGKVGSLSQCSLNCRKRTEEVQSTRIASPRSTLHPFLYALSRSLPEI